MKRVLNGKRNIRTNSRSGIALLVCFLLFIGWAKKATSQVDKWLFHLQLTTNFGQPEQNIGVRLIIDFLVEDNIELSTGYGFTYHLRNYGPVQSHVEHFLIGTAHYLWGGLEDARKHNLSYIKYVDRRRMKNSFGYTWQRFFNSIGTSQNVGSIHLRYEKALFQFSNDVFANTNGKDRYRTGAFSFGLYENKTMVLAKVLIWSGDSHCDSVERIRDSDYPARWGYRDISGCRYGKLSHGILSIGAIHDVGYGQTIGGQLGLDSERIRHFIQNRVFHDLYFIPRFLNKTQNLHLPMKMSNGENYLFGEDQTIRPNRFVWQFSLNPSSLY